MDKFNFTSFIIGFAIALWLGVVLFFLLPQQDKEPCCPVAIPTYTGDSADPLWVPSGEALYRCTNDDRGRGVVEDRGRGVVEDRGRGVVEDRGRGVVEDRGRGVVEDGVARVPAPTGELLDRQRYYREFSCETNKRGGPVVMQGYRVVAVAMAADQPGHQCTIEDGNAVVVNTENGLPVIVSSTGYLADDRGRGVVEDAESYRIPLEQGAVVGEGLDEDESQQLRATELVYCMVLDPAGSAIIVDVNGTKVAPAD